MSESLVVGVADCALSTDASTTLITYALGSCIAVALHDPCARVAGLLHFMLPEPMGNAHHAGENPWMYATTGLPLLLAQAIELGATKRTMHVRLIGGAQVFDDQGLFSIGKKNHVAVRKLLWREGILVQGEAVGGCESRTVWLEVGTGKVRVRQGGRAPVELAPRMKGVHECLSAS